MLFDIPSPRRKSQQDVVGFARVSPAPSGPRYWAPHMISLQNKNIKRTVTTNRRSSCDGATPQPSPSPLSPVSRISLRRNVSTSCVLTVTSPNHHHHSGLRCAPFSPGAGGNNSSKNTTNISSPRKKSINHAMMTVPLPLKGEGDDATDSTACSTEPSDSPNSSSNFSTTDEEIEEKTMLMIDMPSSLPSSDSASSSHKHGNDDCKMNSPDSPSFLRRTSSICRSATVVAGPPPVRNNHNYNESHRFRSTTDASSTMSSKPVGRTGDLRRTNSGILRRESSLLLTPRDKQRALLSRSKSVRFGSVSVVIDLDSSNHSSRNKIETQKDCTTTMTTDDAAAAPTPSSNNANNDNDSSSPRSLSSHFPCETSSSSAASSTPESQPQQPVFIQEQQYSVDQFEQQREQRHREEDVLLDYVLMSQVSLRAQRKAKLLATTAATAVAATTTKSDNVTTMSATKPPQEQHSTKAPLRRARSWLSLSPQKSRVAGSFSSSSSTTATTSQSLAKKPNTASRTATSTIITSAPTAVEQEQSLSSSLSSPKRMPRGIRRYSSAKQLMLGLACK